MISHHPDQFLLTDYAAGSIAAAVALPISVHLEQCEDCRRDVAGLNELGAGLFEKIDPVPTSEKALPEILARIDSDESDSTTLGLRSKASDKMSRGCDGVPRALAHLFPDGLEAANVNWQRITRALSVNHLDVGDPDREVSLHRIKAGEKVPRHSHQGNEFTVVLKGRFSDKDGLYSAGDFLVRTPSDTHQPIAEDDEGCLCLSVLEAPIRFDGIFSRFLNPFLRLHTSTVNA